MLLRTYHHTICIKKRCLKQVGKNGMVFFFFFSIVYIYLVKDGRQTENDYGDGSLVVHDELPQRRIIMAYSLLHFPNSLVHLPLQPKDGKQYRRCGYENSTSAIDRNLLETNHEGVFIIFFQRALVQHQYYIMLRSILGSTTKVLCAFRFENGSRTTTCICAEVDFWGAATVGYEHICTRGVQPRCASW